MHRYPTHEKRRPGGPQEVGEKLHDCTDRSKAGAKAVQQHSNTQVMQANMLPHPEFVAASDVAEEYLWHNGRISA